MEQIEAHIHQHGTGVLVDVHGKRDPCAGLGDCDIGLGATRALLGEERTAMLCDQLADSLDKVLAGQQDKPGFAVDRMPRLQGYLQNGRVTMSQQAVGAGMLAVQLELSYRLRHELARDSALLEQLAAALQAGLRGWAEISYIDGARGES